ncbi:phosphoribosylformylglycinamidine synthase subunit PurQ [Halobacteriovorax marinus]|uniref:phosphoribosylformylglycinamidine synthase subunit PurQ n=1 Tax=Halobacteriovorax marinus TaxID=97084 RepID=UPI003A92A696
MEIKVLVLCGDGLNCENETAYAFTKYGAQSDIVHINDLLLRPSSLLEYDIFVIPGGFSFGDEISAARILSLKLLKGLRRELEKFIELSRPILGICNGAQALMEMGLLPFGDFSKRGVITDNIPRGFMDKWVSLELKQSICKWISDDDIGVTSMPIRHGQGRFVFDESVELDSLIEGKQIVYSYCENPNSSTLDIAALCDPKGLILGLMPHPEASIDTDLLPIGILNHSSSNIFKTIISYMENIKNGVSNGK